MDFLNLHELEERARGTLSEAVYDYYAGGADDEITVADNVLAWRRLRLRYRVLRGIREADVSVTLFGQKLDLPVLVAPTALQALAHPDGERATAEAVAERGSLQILSTLSTVAMEEAAGASGGRTWFQLYLYRDRSINERLVERAQAAGCRAIVLTVDAPALGKRERDHKHRLHLPEGMRLANLHPQEAELPRVENGSSITAYAAAMFKPDLGWDDLAWLTEFSSLPVLVKGVVHPRDAALAVERGAAGVIVSNHGGRQLDTSPATAEVLAEIVATVRGRVPVIVDGGIRRGTDVVKALALGAQAVAVGRPVLWGLALGGREGVSAVLARLGAEIELAMKLCGCRRLADITPDLVLHPR
jgi:4-hydroxymandelate oxidase